MPLDYVSKPNFMCASVTYKLTTEWRVLLKGCSFMSLMLYSLF
jgi:hypothetical protein